MGSFSGIERAQISAGGIYFLAGTYRVRIREVKSIKSRKNDDLFIVETDIVESNNPERKVGTSCSWVCNLKHDAALGNIKAFVVAAAQCPEEQVTEGEIELIVSNDNPLKDVELRLIV